MLIRHARGGALACFLVLGAVQPALPAEAPFPIVVVDVAATSAGARSGIEPGDTLLAWSRDGSAAGSTEGLLTSPFEFRRLEEEESALGAIVISGTRHGEPQHWRMPSAPWGIGVRPGFPAELRKRCDAGLVALDGTSPEDEYLADMLDGWREVIAEVESIGGPLAGAWLRAETGMRLVDAGVRFEGDSSYEEAIVTAARAAPPASTTAVAQLYDDWASALELGGDRESAMQRLELGVQTAPEGSLARAHLQSRLGVLLRRVGDLDRAELLIREASAIREVAAPDSLLVAASLYDLLLLARNRGDLEAAESAGSRALSIQEADDPASLATARTRSILGQVALNRGDFDTAAGLMHASYGTFSTLAPGSRDHGGAATNLGILARRQGDAETAMTRFTEALAILEALNPASGAVAMLNNNIGVVAYDYGDLARSEEHLARALAIHERTGPGSLEIALYLDNLAGIAQERGDLARAEQLHRRALTIREQKAPGSLEVATTLGNLGDLVHQRGDLERAAVYYERALEIEQSQAPGSLQEAATLSDLGLLAERRGDLALAESRLRQSLAMREQLATDSLDVASALSALASVSARKEELDAAQKSARRALSIREARAAISLPTAASLYQLGRLALRGGDADAAAVHLDRSLELRRQLVPGSHWVASAWNGLGEALRMSGEVAASLDALCRATEILDGDISRISEIEEGRASFRARFSDYYRDCIGALVAAGRPEEAFAGLERFRARWLLAMLAERDILFEVDLPIDLSSRMRRNQIEFDRIVTGLSRLEAGDGSDAAREHRARMVDLREEREEIAKTIRTLSPRLARLQYPEPLALDAARQSLPVGTVLLSYSVGTEGTVLFALRREGVEGGRRGASFQAIVVPATRADLTNDVRWLRDAIQEKDPEDLVIRQAAELYDLLIRPAEALMAPGDALLIAPDGPLNSLPFAALVREDEVSGRSFLVEQRPLHFVVSASVYAQLAQPLRDRREEEPMLVAFGDPDYGATAPGGADVRRSFVGRAADLTPLPHARREVESIAQLFTESSRIHLGVQATEARAKSLGERVDYVHFACHGVLDERFPLGSALAMALPRSTEQSDDNGFLQAWEIIEQVRVDADLVTLSACETGLGVDMGGEGLVGLVRAFQYAGARSVIASLWKVADRPTADLMQHLYSSLQSGKSKAGALRDAQISLIRNSGTGTKQEDGERGVRRLVGAATDEAPATSHPYYWAAFQLFGAR